jgi:hypothetical protein
VPTFIKDRKRLPDTAQTTAARIELLGFGWVYQEDARLGDLSRRVQVRDMDALAPPGEVSKYATDLKRGDIMPPVIQTRDGYLVDGNTRTQAAIKAGWPYFPAFILDVDFETAPEAMRKQLVILGSAFNLTHGRGMSRKNIERVIQAVASPGDKAKDIAEKLHISQSQVTSVLNVTRARKRAEQLGVDVSDEEAVSVSHLRMLGGRTVRYTDPVYREFVTLIRDGRMSVKDAKELGTKIEGLTNEDDKLAVLDEERVARRDIIAGGAKKPALSAKLRQTLGFAISNGDEPGNLVELAVASRPLHRRTLVDTISILQKVLAEQDNLR